MAIYVNAGGTSKQNTCKCKVKFSNGQEKGKWIAHWMLNSKKKYDKCSMVVKISNSSTWTNCKNNADLGAHIRQKSSSSSNDQFIVPACRSCNGYKPQNVDFKLKKGTEKVRALVSHCKGSSNVNFASNLASMPGKTTTTVCRRFGCSVNPQGRRHYCSSHRNNSSTSNSKRTCKKSGCSVNPQGRRHYCSSHRNNSSTSNSKRTCKKSGCSVNPQGRRHYCSSHR
jgi:hypothetical protein